MLLYICVYCYIDTESAVHMCMLLHRHRCCYIECVDRHWCIDVDTDLAPPPQEQKMLMPFRIRFGSCAVIPK